MAARLECDTFGLDCRLGLAWLGKSKWISYLAVAFCFSYFSFFLIEEVISENICL